MLTADQSAALINQALVEIQNGNPQNGWLLLQTAHDGGSRRAELHVGFGAVYERQGELAQAAAAFDYAVNLDRNSAPAYNNRGRIYLMAGLLDGAMADFQQALALQPENARAHYNVGGVLAGQGRFAEALQSFQHAAALHYAPALQALKELQAQVNNGAAHQANHTSHDTPAGDARLLRALITLATFAYATSGPDRRLRVVEAKRFLGLGSKQQVHQQVRWAATIEELHELDQHGYRASLRGATLEIGQQPPFLLRVTAPSAGECELSIWREYPVAGTKQQAFKKMQAHSYTFKEIELAARLDALLATGVLGLTGETLIYLGE